MRILITHVVGIVLAISLGDVAAQRVSAEQYPAKPIRLIVPLAPGGGTDIIARAISQGLGQAWNHPVVTDNRPGAAGNIAADIVAKADPDGYTLLLIYFGHAISAAYPNRKLSYDLMKDLTPVTLVTRQAYFLVINPDVPARSVSELIALAKAKPGALNYGSSGTGGGNHLMSALFTSLAGVNIVHVPYKGGAPALTAVVGGQIEMMFSSLLLARAQLNAGRLRMLAVTTAQRSRAAPDIPTLQESGVPGYEVSGWFGVSAPANTPRAIIVKLNQEIARLMQKAELADRLLASAVEPVGNTPEQFGEFLKVEIVKWAKAIRDAGVRAD